MRISKEMLKVQKNTLRKNEVCQKIIRDKDGKLKGVTTIMEELQKMFKEGQNEYNSDYYNSNHMRNDSVCK